MSNRLAAPLWAVLALSVSSGVPAADPPAQPKPAPCAAPEQHQFDFWIGEWDVTANGKLAGHSRIERLLGGCAILENWSGAGGVEGKSLNFFDSNDGRWHQTWIDASGSALFLSGTFSKGAMRLEGDRAATAQAPAQIHRITWTRLPDGKVRQLWEQGTPGSETWQTMFDGLYAPRVAK